MKANLTAREFEQFSAYLDGQLTPGETAKIEELLRANSGWRLAIEELAATRSLLRSAPRYRIPHSFTLTPEMARQAKRRSFFPPFPAFRFSTALAALSILAVGVLQLVGMRSALSVNQLALAPQSAPVAMEAAPEMKAAADSAAPESPAPQATAASEPGYILEWAPATGIGGGGGGDGMVPDGYRTYNSGPSGGIVTYGDQIAPQQAFGMGGGGGAAAPLTVPPNAVAEAVGEAERSAEQSSEPLLPEGSSPILGVPAAGEAGRVIGSSGPVVTADRETSGAALEGLTGLQMAQIGLGILAAAALGAALIFRSRRW